MLNKSHILLTIFALSFVCCTVSAQAKLLRLDSWMSLLDDTVKVCKVSIPGTHDALTAEGFVDSKFIDDYTTQVAGLDKQLNGGIRYIDVRLLMSEENDSIVIRASHRTAAIKLTFNDVLDKLSRFLQLHNKEFVIMKIQYDGDKMDDEQFSQWNHLMQQSLSSKASLFASFRPDMRVCDVRGKVILFSRTNYGDKTFGAYTNWTDEGKPEILPFDSVAERSLFLSLDPQSVEPFKRGNDMNAATLYVQDYYNTIADRQQEKQKALTAMYNSSVAIPYYNNVWIINHMSGFGSPKMNVQGYAENASHTNTCLLSMLQHHKGNLGIVPMDFACTDQLPRKIGSLTIKQRNVMSRSLIKAIIENNFK